MEGDQKIPKGIYRDGDVVAPLFVESITYVLESLMTKKLRTEPKLTKNLLMTLFFYRLESLQFHNSLQFEVGTKDYLQGKAILNDIIQVANENPLLFLKTCQNI